MLILLLLFALWVYLGARRLNAMTPQARAVEDAWWRGWWWGSWK